MAKRVIAPDRALTRTVCAEWSKFSSGGYVAHRFGIHQRRCECQWPICADVLHMKILNIEDQRQFVWTRGIDNQSGSFGVEFVNDNLDLSAFWHRVSKLHTVFFGRDIQLQALYENRSYMHRRSEQAHDSGVETEFVNRNEWLNSFALDVGISWSVNFQTLARN